MTIAVLIHIDRNIKMPRFIKLNYTNIFCFNLPVDVGSRDSAQTESI